MGNLEKKKGFQWNYYDWYLSTSISGVISEHASIDDDCSSTFASNWFISSLNSYFEQISTNVSFNSFN